MLTWAHRKVKELEAENLCGFIFKKDSPSSGMTRVKVYNATGMPTRKGSGMFANAFMRHFPRLPVEDEGRLHDPKLRENFIERVFALRRWRQAVHNSKGMGWIVDFHSREKLLLMAHSPKHYRSLGQLVAGGKRMNPTALKAEYESTFCRALSFKTTPAKNVNVLQHILGYFKKQLTADEKQEMLDIIQSYRKGDVPLIVPITLVNHYTRKYKQAYLTRQSYLDPHPLDLQLRNHV
jgi:uncharacterized protein YbgA (DUF1722 family)